MYPIDSISSLSFNLTIVSYTRNIFSIFNEKKDGSFTPEETKMLSILRIASFDIAYRPLFLDKRGFRKVCDLYFLILSIELSTVFTKI